MNQATTLGKVLVLDGDMIPALTIVRSLSRKGLIVDIASHLNKPLASYSRHVKYTLTYPDPLTCENEFLAWCESFISRADYRLIIPVTERSLIPIQKLKDNSGTKKLAMAPNNALAVALDKSHTLELATKLGIPVPQSQLIETREQITQHIPNFTFPVVIKPIRSIGENQAGRKRLSVEYAFNPRELSEKTKHFLNFGSVLLQEYIQGQGVGVELIADYGNVVYAFQHLRLHEVPLTGGGSSLRISVPIEPDLLDATKKLMQALEWHGVAMVEFKWNPNNRTFALMEINGRFWGSLPLAVAAGADFPAMLYELMVEGAVKEQPVPRLGIYTRKLSSDILWYEQIIRRDVPAGFRDFPSGMGILRDLIRIFSRHHFFDVQQWRDPLPGIIDLGRIAQSYFDRIKRLIHHYHFLRAQHKAWSSGRVSQRLRNARQILFLCYGNINRSPVAERYLKSIISDTFIKVVSAGFHDEEGRPADPIMVEVAHEAGIDMKNWLSRRLTHKMVDESDIILAMEQRHYEQLTTEFPEAAQKTFLLGAAVSNGVTNGEIEDPYGYPRSAYERCVYRVTASVNEVAKLITTPLK